MLRRSLSRRQGQRASAVLKLAVTIALLGCDAGQADLSHESVIGRSPHEELAQERAPGSDDDPIPSKPPVVTPSGYLLLSAERLAELKTMVSEGHPDWLDFKARVDDRLDEMIIYNDSPENRALVYLLTGEQTYADAAWSFAQYLMDSEDVRFDSYLHFGDLMRHAAVVLNYCEKGLSDEQRAALIGYLDNWTHELWFDNQGSGWGLADPGNNYHHAFLEGTAYAGYALRQASEPSGQTYVDILDDKIKQSDGVLDYLTGHVPGGGWPEGTNYGERSKQRLHDALSVIASMGDTNYLYDHPYVAETVRYAIYELQPDGLSLYPGGDLARDSAMPVSPAERDYLSVARFWLGEGQAPSLASWYLDNVAMTFDVPGYRNLAFKDMVFGSATVALEPATLPLSYHAPGTGLINLRSTWQADATSISISAPSIIEQSHQHIDAASFVIFKHDWLAMDATSLSSSGLNWSSCAHNTICVAGSQHRDGSVGGVTAMNDDGQVAYVAVDATDQYRHRPNTEVITMLTEHTRELVYLRPDTLVVYDRVVPKQGADYDWRLHLPAAPSAVGNSWQLTHGGAGITLRPILGQVTGVEDDGDLEGGESSALRIVEVPANPAQGRLLNVVAVADGAAPSLTASAVSSSAVDGVVLSDAVAVFSKNPQGAPASLPLSYTVSGTQTRLHVITNLAAQSIDVTVQAQGSNKTITLTPGTTHTPTSAGTLTVSL